MVKKSNLNLYDSTGSDKFSISCRDGDVLITSDQPIKIPDISIGHVDSVLGTLEQVQGGVKRCVEAVVLEKQEREAKQNECMVICEKKVIDGLALEKQAREAKQNECMVMCEKKVIDGLAVEKQEREAKQIECMAMCEKKCMSKISDDIANETLQRRFDISSERNLRDQAISRAVGMEKEKREASVKSVTDKIDKLLNAAPEKADTLKELLNLMEGSDNSIKGLIVKLTARVVKLEADMTALNTTVDDLTADP